MSKPIDFTFKAYIGDDLVRFESVAGVDGKDYITGGPYESVEPEELPQNIYDTWHTEWLYQQLEEDFGDE